MPSPNPYRTNLRLDEYLEEDPVPGANHDERPVVPLKKRESSPSHHSGRDTRSSSADAIVAGAPSEKRSSHSHDKGSSNTRITHALAGEQLNDYNDVLDSGARLVIAVDYGTTYTGLAWNFSGSGNADSRTVHVLQNWTASMSNQDKVRSMYAYTRTGEAYWGSDIGDDAVAMVNTKLELDPRETRLDELEATLHLVRGTKNLAFAHVLHAGPQPAYTANSPKQIITDYLTKIRECASKDDSINVAKLVTTKTPVDLVITVPMNWSYQAKNATFQAFRDAGFNRETFPTMESTILVNEPEAASHFIAQDLQANGTAFPDAEQCYILCDAGGGTVDVVSFQVKSSGSFLEFEKATNPSSGRFGSVFIDLEFKLWLRDEIGIDNYIRLDPANAQKRIYPGAECHDPFVTTNMLQQQTRNQFAAETGPMRKLVRRFEARKKAFSETTSSVKLDLPEPLHKLSIPGRVKDGELTISNEEMQKLFAPSIDGVIELIGGQIQEIKRKKNRRVKCVYLVGGFGASPYLQYQLKQSLDLIPIKMQRPDATKSWTATVRGAAMYGVEKGRKTNVEYVAAVTRSYAIRVSSGRRFQWLVRKGDLMLRHETRHIESQQFWMSQNQAGGVQVPLYTYTSTDEDVEPDEWEDGQHEVAPVLRVDCDLGRLRGMNLRQRYANNLPYPQNSLRQQRSWLGPFVCRLQLVGSKLAMSVVMNKVEVGKAEMQVEVDWPRNTNMPYASGVWQDAEE